MKKGKRSNLTERENKDLFNGGSLVEDRGFGGYSGTAYLGGWTYRHS